MKLAKVFPIMALLLIVFLTGCNKKDEFVGIPPRVISTNPISDAVGVALGSNISATFSSEMNPLTMTTANFVVMQGTQVVPGAVSYSDSVAIFNPTVDFSASSLYDVSISTGAKNNDGLGLEKDYEWSFTTGLVPDAAIPTVTLTDPLNDATGVAISKVVEVTFSEPMDPPTITSLTYTLKQGSTSVAGVVTYSGTKATFTPSANLDYNKIYTGTITTGAKDLDGNALAANYTFSFTTAAVPDLALPMVMSTVPLALATGVAVNSTVAVTFNEPMTPSTLNSSTFTLKKGTTPVAGTIVYSGNTATFTPDVALENATVYTATVTTGAQDLAGNALAANHTFSFTTVAAADTEMPTVISTVPIALATDIAVNSAVSVTFSEPMTSSTINTSTFTLMNGTTPVAGTVVYSGNTATFTPAVVLENATVYTATVTTGAQDLAGNALAANYTFSFTTVDAPDTDLPTAVSTAPIALATGIAVNSSVSVTFSEPMNPSTINTSTFTLMNGTTPVAGTVVYSGNTATFTPSVNLEGSTTYTATVTTGAEDLAGNALATDLVWTFTTESLVPLLGVVDLGSAVNYVILAKTAINNSPTSEITGDLGLSPAATSYITGLSLTDFTGYATSAQVTGRVYAADMADPTPINLTTAVENMITAYNDAAGRPTPDYLELGTGAIGGMTLQAGLYKWTTSVTMSSDVTINGGANDVWIFQISEDLLMANGVHLNLTGGAQAKNIFWQVAGQATFGTTSHMEGIILSMTGITFQTGASFKGRALAQTAVVLDGNIVIVP
jgi:hypothetical protein